MKDREAARRIVCREMGLRTYELSSSYAMKLVKGGVYRDIYGKALCVMPQEHCL
jgi:hypothetical protein